MTQKLTTPYHQTQRLFFVALSIFLILFGLYVYFISASVVHVIARKEVDREITYLHSHISDLESSYIDAKQAIGEDTIGQYGFVPAPKKVYVVKAPDNLVLLTHEN
ncbi:hypothetical protein HY416_00630 [Candidatus Kaiserbacteria bacterium]|nr:hypothetical protein [Candidatus Kaiserbacteria bacterium]